MDKIVIALSQREVHDLTTFAPSGYTEWELNRTGKAWVHTRKSYGVIPTEDRPLRIGTVAGRHQMPVDVYVIDRHLGDNELGQKAFNLALKSLSSLLDITGSCPIEVYYSGLTEVTLAVIQLLQKKKINFTIMKFEKDGTYSPLDIRV